MSTPRWLDDQPVSEQNRKLIWVAKYRDGIEFSQYSDNIEQSSELIDHKKLWILKLLDKSGKVIISQEYRKGQMPFYRRRTAIRPGDNVIETIHILGWRIKFDNIIFTHAAFVYESDMHIEMGEFRGDNEVMTRAEEWQYPITFRNVDEIVVE